MITPDELRKTPAPNSSQAAPRAGRCRRTPSQQAAALSQPTPTPQDTWIQGLSGAQAKPPMRATMTTMYPANRRDLTALTVDRRQPDLSGRGILMSHIHRPTDR